MDRPLNVHIVTEEDPFYIPEFFQEFLPIYPRDAIHLTGVDITPPLNQRSRRKLAKRLLRFYGPVDFVRLAFRLAKIKTTNLVVRGVLDGDLRPLLADHAIESRTVANVNAEEYVSRLRKLQPDLLISVAASQIFKGPLLAVPKLDCLNVHCGALPAYRGMLPVFWQMYDSQPEVGITIHTMTPKIDIGEIVLSRGVPLAGIDCLDVAIRRMKRESAHVLIDVIEQFRAGSVTRVPMDMQGARYRSFPGRRESQEFRKRRLRLV